MIGKQLESNKKTNKRSLKGNGHTLANTFVQLEVLNQAVQQGQAASQASGLPKFAHTLKAADASMYPLRATGIDVLQINIGKKCNQICKHCHVDAGPDRTEMMSRTLLEKCIVILKSSNIKTVDITGGAPEMHQDFRWFVASCYQLGIHVINRCNLTIITANPKYHDLPRFFADHNVELVSSLPHFTARRTDSQRGKGVFEASIEGVKRLNAVGYGMPNSGLQLQFVYNPAGAFLPADQAALQVEFKRQLSRRHQIYFNNLYAITNLPISRFLVYLLDSGNYNSYMQELIAAFNIQAAKNVMCRNTISVSWDGYLYDCDFNQMLDLKLSTKAIQHINDLNTDTLNYLKDRTIVLNQHCYGCTAGAGSSCGGEVA